MFYRFVKKSYTNSHDFTDVFHVFLLGPAHCLWVFLWSDLLSSLFVMLFKLKLLVVVILLLQGCELSTLENCPMAFTYRGC